MFASFVTGWGIVTLTQWEDKMAHFEYRIQRGDSMASIARRFGYASNPDVERWWAQVLNHAPNKWIQHPRQLTLNTMLIVPTHVVRQRFNGATYVADRPIAAPAISEAAPPGIRLERLSDSRNNPIIRHTGVRG